MSSFATAFRRLFETSPAIEARPLWRRPRFMAATWGGMIVCKAACVVTLGPAVGIPLLLATIFVGSGATWLRFGEQGPIHRPGRLVLQD